MLTPFSSEIISIKNPLEGMSCPETVPGLLLAFWLLSIDLATTVVAAAIPSRMRVTLGIAIIGDVLLHSNRYIYELTMIMLQKASCERPRLKDGFGRVW